MKRNRKITVKLHIHNLVDYKLIGNDIYENVAEEVLKYAQYSLEDAEITLVLCDNSFIRDLNYKYRGFNQPTDVLSFYMNEKDEIIEPLLGDIVISVDMAKENCLLSVLTLNEEIIYLFTHGILHLIGYDHESSMADEEKMYNIQDKIIKYFHSLMK
jgi:probable rRNA maturation factor